MYSVLRTNIDCICNTSIPFESSLCFHHALSVIRYKKIMVHRIHLNSSTCRNGARYLHHRHSSL